MKIWKRILALKFLTEPSVMTVVTAQPAYIMKQGTLTTTDVVTVIITEAIIIRLNVKAV